MLGAEKGATGFTQQPNQTSIHGKFAKVEAA
jgi:hypothetical protein